MAKITCPNCKHKFDPDDGAKVPNSYVEEVYGHYLEHVHAGAKLTPKSRAKLRKRLTEYDIATLCKAIDNFSRDSWWMQHNSKRGVAWFFNSQDRIEQFINLEPRGGLKKI